MSCLKIVNNNASPAYIHLYENLTIMVCNCNAKVQGVPLPTEPGISLIILPLMRILQRNLKRTYT